MGPTKKRTLRDLIDRLKYDIQLLSSINYQLSQQLTPGKRQSLLKDQVYKESRIKSSIQKIDNLFNGNIVTITFQDKDSGEIFKSVYTNVSQEEVKEYVTFLARLKGREISILEIKDVNTKNLNRKL
jgi:hypothetical protein